MHVQHLTIAYECLNAIGNTLEFESMVSEILITFSRKTGAESGYYFNSFDDTAPAIKIGKEIDFTFNKKKLLKETSFVITHPDSNLHAVILPLENSYLQFIYKNPLVDIHALASIFGNFRQKIIIAVNACHGVKELELLNEALEDRVQKAIAKNRQNEKMMLAQSKQAIMGEMVEMIAHQWRQPITAIGMTANNLLFDLVMNELNVDSTSAELESINAQVSFLSETIDNFRSFFRSSKQKEDVSMKEIFGNTLVLVQKQLEHRNIVVQVDSLCDEIMLHTFKNELIQVLLNIISNAKDALSEKEQKEKKIVIDCKKTANHIAISIEDNAGGIDETIMPHIFEPYFTTKAEKNGTGLGLYMSQTIVNEHLKGSIKVNNTKYGAEFVIQISTKGSKNE